MKDTSSFSKGHFVGSAFLALNCKMALSPLDEVHIFQAEEVRPCYLSRSSPFQYLVRTGGLQDFPTLLTFQWSSSSFHRLPGGRPRRAGGGRGMSNKSLPLKYKMPFLDRAGWRGSGLLSRLSTILQPEARAKHDATCDGHCCSHRRGDR